MGGAAPRQCLEEISDVMLALSRHHMSSLQQWMTSVVERQDFPNRLATTENKTAFFKGVLKYEISPAVFRLNFPRVPELVFDFGVLNIFCRDRVVKRRMKELVQEYSLLWRGLLGSEYAAQTSVQYIKNRTAPLA